MRKPYVEHEQSGRGAKRRSHRDVHIHACASGQLKRNEQMRRVDRWSGLYIYEPCAL
jgi:hypothetical protein